MKNDAEIFKVVNSQSPNVAGNFQQLKEVHTHARTNTRDSFN